MTTRFSIIRRLTLVAFLGFQVIAGQSATIILTSDQQLNDLLDPHKKIDFITSEKLLELAAINEKGKILIKDKKYTTLLTISWQS